jgi:hypothetical protein
LPVEFKDFTTQLIGDPFCVREQRESKGLNGRNPFSLSHLTSITEPLQIIGGKTRQSKKVNEVAFPEEAGS